MGPRGYPAEFRRRVLGLIWRWLDEDAIKPWTQTAAFDAIPLAAVRAAATFDPTKIDDADARIHVIRFQEHMTKPGWKRTLGIG